MRYGPNQDPKMTIAVFYDRNGVRTHKLFDCPIKARSFYKAKFISGKNPSLKAQIND